MAVQLSEHFTYKKLFQFCLPTIMMMIFTSIYGVVDGFFISNYVGKIPFAALNLIWPAIMILGSAGFMIGTGGSALVAKSLGEGRKELAHRYFTMLIELTLILGILLSVTGIIFVRPMAYAMGATEEMIQDCVLYGRWMLAFNVSFMLQNVFQSFFITAEKPKLGLWTIVAAGITNMVLDWLLVAVLQWGLTGAAIATGLSQCVGGVLPLIYFYRENTSLLRLVRTGMERKPLVQACINGSSELMTNVSASIVSILYNYQLLKVAGENGVAAYGVLMYVQFVFIAVFFGYAIGTGPIISFHYGAGNYRELNNMLRKSMWLMGAGGVLLSVLAVVLAAPLAQIFVGYDIELYKMTKHGCQLFACSFLLTGVNIFTSAFFTALNNGVISAVISFLRTLVFQMVCVLLLPILFGIDGIWWAVTVAEVLASVVSLTFIYTQRKKYYYM